MVWYDEVIRLRRANVGCRLAHEDRMVEKTGTGYALSDDGDEVGFVDDAMNAVWFLRCGEVRGVKRNVS